MGAPRTAAQKGKSFVLELRSPAWLLNRMFRTLYKIEKISSAISLLILKGMNLRMVILNRYMSRFGGIECLGSNAGKDCRGCV